MRLASLLLLTLITGCRCGPVIEQPDAGVDAGSPVGEGEGEGSEGEGEGVGPDGGPACGPSTPTFGDACGQCGKNVCNPISQVIVCNDPGFNACGVCDVDGGVLDESAGRIGQPCGVELCGVGQCNSAGTASECIGGDTLRNVCSGCLPLDPPDAGPGDTCSSCGTGVQTCTTDHEHFICHQGREPDNQCVGCGRCVLFHANMADHVAGGGYLNPGTTAVVEDIGTNNIEGGSHVKLSFDPLVEGPGACCIPVGAVFLSSAENPFTASSVQLTPLFASSVQGVLADPVRYYDVPPTVDPNALRFVVLVDESGLFEDPVLSVGELVAGP